MRETNICDPLLVCYNNSNSELASLGEISKTLKHDRTFNKKLGPFTQHQYSIEMHNINIIDTTKTYSLLKSYWIGY